MEECHKSPARAEVEAGRFSGRCTSTVYSIGTKPQKEQLCINAFINKQIRSFNEKCALNEHMIPDAVIAETLAVRMYQDPENLTATALRHQRIIQSELVIRETVTISDSIWLHDKLDVETGLLHPGKPSKPSLHKRSLIPWLWERIGGPCNAPRKNITPRCGMWRAEIVAPTSPCGEAGAGGHVIL